MRDSGRLSLASATDEEALLAFARLCKEEGILPALESSHALARIADIGREHGTNALVVVSLSGRGDKDLAEGRNGGDPVGMEDRWAPHSGESTGPF